MQLRHKIDLFFAIINNIKIPVRSYFIKSDNIMLGRWGSVKDTKNKTNYGYDCAKEFNNKN